MNFQAVAFGSLGAFLGVFGGGCGWFVSLFTVAEGRMI